MFWKKKTPPPVIPTPEEFLRAQKRRKKEEREEVEKIKSKVYILAKDKLIESMNNGCVMDNFIFINDFQSIKNTNHLKDAFEKVAVLLQAELQEMGYPQASIAFRDGTRLLMNLGRE